MTPVPKPALTGPALVLAPGTALTVLAVVAAVALRVAGFDTHGFSWLVAGLVAGFSLSGSV